MRRKYIVALAVAAVLVGVAVLIPYLFDRSGTCAPIGTATRVIIFSKGFAASPDRVVTDAERIRQLIAFANARRECSQYGIELPSPGTRAVFYGGDVFLGAIGWGPNFFFVSCPNWSGTRPASDAEIREFKRLIGHAN